MTTMTVMMATMILILLHFLLQLVEGMCVTINDQGGVL